MDWRSPPRNCPKISARPELFQREGIFWDHPRFLAVLKHPKGNAIGKCGDGLAISTPKLSQNFSTIGAVSEGGDILGPSPRSCGFKTSQRKCNRKIWRRVGNLHPEIIPKFQHDRSCFRGRGYFGTIPAFLRFFKHPKGSRQNPLNPGHYDDTTSTFCSKLRGMIKY